MTRKAMTTSMHVDAQHTLLHGKVNCLYTSSAALYSTVCTTSVAPRGCKMESSSSSSSSSDFTLSSGCNRVDIVGESFSLHGAYFRPLPSLCGADVSRLSAVLEPPPPTTPPPASASPLQRLKGSSAITTLLSSNTACYVAAQTRRKVCSSPPLVCAGLSCCLCVSISRYSTGSSCLHLHLLKPAW